MTSMILAQDINDNDVLFGRGTGPNDHAGNVFFRRLIQAQHTKYQSSLVRGEKATIAREVIETIHRNTGRFLQRCQHVEHSPKKKTRHDWGESVDMKEPSYSAILKTGDQDSEGGDDDENDAGSLLYIVVEDMKSLLLKTKLAFQHCNRTAQRHQGRRGQLRTDGNEMVSAVQSRRRSSSLCSSAKQTIAGLKLPDQDDDDDGDPLPHHQYHEKRISERDDAAQHLPYPPEQCSSDIIALQEAPIHDALTSPGTAAAAATNNTANDEDQSSAMECLLLKQRVATLEQAIQDQGMAMEQALRQQQQQTNILVCNLPSALLGTILPSTLMPSSTNTVMTSLLSSSHHHIPSAINNNSILLPPLLQMLPLSNRYIATGIDPFPSQQMHRVQQALQLLGQSPPSAIATLDERLGILLPRSGNISTAPVSGLPSHDHHPLYNLQQLQYASGTANSTDCTTELLIKSIPFFP